MGGDTIENEALGRMVKLVNFLISRPDSSPFREPVDFHGLQLWDYPKIIKKVRNNFERDYNTNRRYKVLVQMKIGL